MGSNKEDEQWSRRKLLRWGVAGSLGATGTWLGWQAIAKSRARLTPPMMVDRDTESPGFKPVQFLRAFDYGKVYKENGRTVREFTIRAGTSEVKLDNATSFITWNFNGQVPAPTLRANQGDRIRVVFYNQGGHAHSIHFHGVHPAAMDGIKPIKQSKVFIYEFDAETYGVHPYHCHVEPVTRHIGKGLYGMLIVDPPTPRPIADEMVLIMGAYDLDENRKNELYAFNGLPHYYMHNPIPIRKDQLVRLYVQNMIEFDAAATFHLHANMFKVYPTGHTLQPLYESDVITMGTAERHILEFTFKYTGQYMFHPHQDYMASAGCMGIFDVVGPT
jgi:manganese oxidase